MAFLAGATDVTGLTRLGDLFVSFMSGNTTKLGLALGRADVARAGSVAVLIGLFVAGAALGAVLAASAGRWRASAVSLAAAALLWAAAAWPNRAVLVFPAAMGALNAAVPHLGEEPVGLTYMTGALAKLGQGIGRLVCGDPGGWRWAWGAPLWSSLLAGAVCAAALGEPAWLPPTLATAVAAAALLRDVGRANDRLPAP